MANYWLRASDSPYMVQHSNQPRELQVYGPPHWWVWLKVYASVAWHTSHTQTQESREKENTPDTIPFINKELPQINKNSTIHTKIRQKRKLKLNGAPHVLPGISPPESLRNPNPGSSRLKPRPESHTDWTSSFLHPRLLPLVYNFLKISESPAQ